MDFNSLDRQQDERGRKNPDEDLGFDVRGSAGSSKIEAEFPTEDIPLSPPIQVPVHPHKDGNNLLFKLRINNNQKSPKEIRDSGYGSGSAAAADDDENQSRVVLNNSKKYSHFCKECNKGFSCGKALGGHMSSAHVQAKDHLRKLKMRQSESFLDKYDGEDGDEEDERYVCRLCNKEFPSRKSLYGHMRCHPERDWRGMEPPSSKSKHQRSRICTTASTVVDDYEDEEEEPDHHLDFYSNEDEEKVFDKVHEDNTFPVDNDVHVRDLSNVLGDSWGATGKRGRDAVVKMNIDMGMDSLSDYKERKKLVIAVTQLLRLVNSGEKVVTGHEVQRENFSIDDDSSNDSEETDGEDEWNSKGTNSSRGDAQMRYDYDDFNGINVQKRQRSMELEQTITPEKHACSDCNKIFSSHQALGGHRSSHNKVKMSVQNAVIQPLDGYRHGLFVPSVIPLSGDRHGVMKVAPNENTIHKCEICGKTFLSGQALGGHKRCHYTMPEGSSSSQFASNPDDDDGVKPGRKIRDFDLNEKPEVEVGEDDNHNVSS
ncbi:OLC1v1005145C1 [Oldenlandia corymbosa var. corymbosa]|uniref:OLC1v1005145C1 n=1 Tax=Oldenlandia corymbosa var. corymbosa TaxID=529605 RepID=A0AAV1DDY4_OLDCO|nr:OLC1v1005145C1 [Oldenlandia corymbosa var. corymbosa]